MPAEIQRAGKAASVVVSTWAPIKDPIVVVYTNGIVDILCNSGEFTVHINNVDIVWVNNSKPLTSEPGGLTLVQ